MKEIKEPKKIEDLPKTASLKNLKFAELQMTTYEYERLDKWFAIIERLYVGVSAGDLKNILRLLYALENAYLILRPLLKKTQIREKMDALLKEIETKIWNERLGKEKLNFWELKEKIREFYWKLKDIQDMVGAGIMASSYEGYLEEELEEEEML